MHPVLETSALPDFAFWPVAPQQAYQHMSLSGTLSADQIGTIMAILADCNSNHAVSQPADPAEAFLSSLLHDEGFLAPGGLLVQDTETGTTLLPGCCCGLEDWRDWLEVADGGETWLGHDPAPWPEQLGGTVRLHLDGERPGPVIEVTPLELRRLLASVQRDLIDFLYLVTVWAQQHTPASVQTLVDAVDRSLKITESLGTATG